MCICCFSHTSLRYWSVLSSSCVCRSVVSSCSSSNNDMQVVHVWGFEDAPVSQGKLEHSYFLHGENMLSVAFTGSQTHIFKSLATYDHLQ